jgi:hypothetical protein
MSQTQIMINALDSEPGDFKVFGREDLNRYWYIRLTDVNAGNSSNIFKMLPGGTSSKVFLPDVYTGVPEYSNDPTWPVAPLKPSGAKKGSIQNALFAQTLTMYFNLKNNTALGSLMLGDSLITYDAVCGSNTPIANTADTFGIPHNVAVFLAGGNGYANSVQGLFILANDLLGGVNPTGWDIEDALDDVKTAIDNINNGFDNCRIFWGYVPYAQPPVTTNRGGAVTGPTETVIKAPVVVPTLFSKLNVTAYPNPYTDKVKFVIESPVSGEASLEVYNMLGQKLETIFKGTIFSGKQQEVEYNVQPLNRKNLIYILRIGDKQATGKLLHLN